MRVSEFDYELPPDRVAQRPPAERDGARLLVVGRTSRTDALVRDLAAEVPTGAIVVVNDTRVVPSRLYGERRTTRGRVEIMLVAPASGGWNLGADVAGPIVFTALGRASKKLREGAEIEVGERILARVIREATGRDAAIEVSLETTDGSSLGAAIEAAGHVPLPPYIDRADDLVDRERYQTLFATVPGAIAAPTAGLHLSDHVIEALRARGVEIAKVTLHVGLGTFLPVATDDLDDHPMHAETFSVGVETRDRIASARREGRCVVAVGTTVVRALESAADLEKSGEVIATSGDTRLLIQPGYRFRVVDRLLTNFHLPKSTLLALVSAFAGTARIREAYAHAIAHGYRFFSYGDAMLLERSDA